MEGPTTDPAVLTLREQQKRNLMASLILSVGVPMISGSDEMGRTQQGNNNAYCHDSDLSWTPWQLSLAPGGTTYPLQGRTLALFVLSAERPERPPAVADPRT